MKIARDFSICLVSLMVLCVSCSSLTKRGDENQDLKLNNKFELCYYPEAIVTDSLFYSVLDSILGFYQQSEKTCPAHDGYSHLLIISIGIASFDNRYEYSFSANYLNYWIRSGRDILEMPKDYFYGFFYYQNTLFVIHRNNNMIYEPFNLTGCQVPVFDCNNGYLCAANLGDVVYAKGLYSYNLKFDVTADKPIRIR